MLGEQYGRVLESQEISSRTKRGAFFARYCEPRFPSARARIRPLLAADVAELAAAPRRRTPGRARDREHLTATTHLPTRSDTEPEQVARAACARRRSSSGGSPRWSRAAPRSRDAMEREPRARSTATSGNPRSFDRLEALLGDQAYRLASGGVAAEEINYRRFFDINDLAAIRVERPDVFDAVHDTAFQLPARGQGDRACASTTSTACCDPSQLPREPPARQRARAEWASDRAPPPQSTPTDRLQPTSSSRRSWPATRRCPRDWPVHGTTGYEFLNTVNGLFVDAGGARAVDAPVPAPARGGAASFDDLVYRAKRLILRTRDVQRALRARRSRLDRISRAAPLVARLHPEQPAPALREVIACFPVYRTYIQPTPTEVERARPPARRCAPIRDAKRRNPLDQRVGVRLHRATCCCCAIPRGCPTPTAPSGATSCCVSSR